ncbi:MULTISPECIES: electron transfer flavoprotein subunit beta/FixA family protein [Acidaminococcus]|jgi:electron transfer flavoprotein alpha/beta subunit|uniref:Electron transfer flavoprotein small subunit n=2 Tax=Acidaminococcus TaxID=904 RepID=A0A6N7W3E8_ACIFE|nr:MULTISPECIES: electron transfer flavoprotein subunit beta/FixA family protein [Acidaminococcus]MEE1598188.1 electron transfer flavoprotein subunit beta/FixA family protein [Acidaminococcus fermentans]MEE4122450.1 electron transfer flavoprotein subunit beta/FixA family protein [Acidaminococcus fermentans]MSS82972.1 electron transfer flavoprotein subunit beta/FixA family protein [Acidaminococcus fermentans]CDE94761.1 electron transfer flavoprotein alpha/beta-subunit [Acidaminococcus sp. CAG:54
MNIVVCVKQVPDTAEMKIDPVTNNLVRDGVTNIMNPYDQYALETALQLKDELGAHVTVITMGPPHAESVLRDCLAVGADEAKLVSDRAFGGADTLATSAAMANTIKHFGIPDLILCGRQAIDGDTAQVGPEIAEHLDLPQVTAALKVQVKDDTVVVDRDNEQMSMTFTMKMPCVVTVMRSKDLRFASIRGKMKARKAEIPVYTAAALEIPLDIIGKAGSPTQVMKSFTPKVTQVHGEIFDDEDPAVAVDKLVNKLIEDKIITK